MHYAHKIPHALPSLLRCCRARCAAQGLDVGPESITHIKAVLGDCKTVLWNGPLGVFEFPKFAKGTFAVAETLAEITAKGEGAGGGWGCWLGRRPVSAA